MSWTKTKIFALVSAIILAILGVIGAFIAKEEPVEEAPVEEPATDDDDSAAGDDDSAR